MKLLTKTVNNFPQSSILNVWLHSEFASGTNPVFTCIFHIVSKETCRFVILYLSIAVAMIGQNGDPTIDCLKAKADQSKLNSLILQHIYITIYSRFIFYFLQLY